MIARLLYNMPRKWAKESIARTYNNEETNGKDNIQ